MTINGRKNIVTRGAHNNGMHPTADTLLPIFDYLVGRRVTPGVRRFEVMMNLRTQIATLIILLTFLTQVSLGKSGAVMEIKRLEQRIEDAVVKADIRFLRSVYSSDFRFTHGDGEVQNKAEWLALVAKREAVSRKIDTLDVEVHGNVAITFGRLETVWQGEGKGEKYILKYVRVYERKNGRWLLLSHRSVEMLKE